MNAVKGEDGTEMSAAGQMETVLGVRGIDQVKCFFGNFVSILPEHSFNLK
jgi:hypothetical protein